MKYYIVTYKGQFGFIKPWTAVRDIETFSQQFLTPSIVAGMERKIFPHLLNEPFDIYKIKGHRLTYDQMDIQMEQIQPRGWNSKKINKKNIKVRNNAILYRSVLLNPLLKLAFEHREDAIIAAKQHLCLCRNEDIIFPIDIEEIDNATWNNDDQKFSGYELIFEKNDKSFFVGYNRFQEGKPMYGWLKTLGHPVKSF